jgi:nucleotide-binding universal stress UspA family protein
MKMLDRIAGPLNQASVHRIAHATDLTPASENALAWATLLAKANEAELLLLHVVPPPTPIFEVESPMKAKAEFELSVLLTRLKMNGVNARGFVLCGTKSIDYQIIQAARLEKSDLIVMGTSGRTRLSRLFVGSVASRLTVRADCPVLVVPNRSLNSSSSPTVYSQSLSGNKRAKRVF